MVSGTNDKPPDGDDRQATEATANDKPNGRGRRPTDRGNPPDGQTRAIPPENGDRADDDFLYNETVIAEMGLEPGNLPGLTDLTGLDGRPCIAIDDLLDRLPPEGGSS
jgi:hypothetical protein